MKKHFFALLLSAAPVFAQTPSTTEAGGSSVGVTTPAGKPKPLAAGDKKFVKDALDSMYYEMTLAGKVTAKASTAKEPTKTVGAMLKTDLDKVWADVGTLASAHDEKIPTDLTGGDKSKAEKLTKAGDKMDKDFLKIVSTEAGKLSRTFETAAKSASDPEVKRIAAQWAPTLKDHVTKLDAAEKEAAKAK